MSEARASWAEACRTARLLAVDPSLGLVLRGPAGPARDHWIAGLRGHLPKIMPWRRLPAGTPLVRLAGGLDLAATLATGRPVAAGGLLAEADGGMLVIAAAERLDEDAAALVGRALDTGSTPDGAASARLGLLALDEGRDADECLPPALADRLALRLDLGTFGHRDCGPIPPEARAIASARRRLLRVSAGDDTIEALCEAAAALGIAGLRAPLLALKAARAAAALDGRLRVSSEDVALAARLVLGPRATQMPSPPAEAEAEAQAQEPQPPPPDPTDSEERNTKGEGRLAEVAVEAARAALPADLLAALAAGPLTEGRTGGRRGAASAPARRGRPLPSGRGRPDRDRTLDVLGTLRAAAPWQRLRGRPIGSRVLIRPEDLRVRRFEDHQRTTVIVAVDASGSAALHRLAEAKGAVELILAECYLNRDEVALVAFRGAGAEVLLPPTRALARAKRELAALPGGGGTPLAAGLALALDLGRAAARGGRRPVLAVLTDGRANVARDGTGDRTRAAAEATAAAQMVRTAGWAALVIDVSPRPGAAAAGLARALGAGYLPLPQAGAGAIAGAVLAQAGVPPAARQRA